jgi:hypothetical protein
MDPWAWETEQSVHITWNSLRRLLTLGASDLRVGTSSRIAPQMSDVTARQAMRNPEWGYG